MQKSSDIKNSEEWTKVQSKRHPNKFYYFNIKTGESKWANDGNDPKPNEKLASPKERSLSPKKYYNSKDRRKRTQSRAPAQDRLNILRKTIEKKHKCKSDLTVRLGLNQVVTEIKAQSNVLTTNKNLTTNNIAKITVPKCSVQDRLKIKPVAEDLLLNDGDTVMKDGIKSNPPLQEPDEDDPEYMDWEPIPDEIVLSEISNMRQVDNTLSQKSNEVINLHSLNANSNNFYIVVDTNIFISNLKFLENLNNCIFPQLKHSFLVVPYVVLQELDNLKHRRNDKISKIASHAISFLNRSFTSPSSTSRLCGQSAIKCNEHLIEIQNSDDKIINCCLQIARGGNWVILMSNDVNLRNKALFNDIKAYSKEDLENNKISLAEELSKFH